MLHGEPKLYLGRLVAINFRIRVGKCSREDKYGSCGATIRDILTRIYAWASQGLLRYRPEHCFPVLTQCSMELWLWTAQGRQTFTSSVSGLNARCGLQALDIAIDHIILHTPSPLLSITPSRILIYATKQSEDHKFLFLSPRYAHNICTRASTTALVFAYRE